MARRAKRTLKKVAYGTIGAITGVVITVGNAVLTPVMIPVNAVKGAKKGVQQATKARHREEPETKPEDIKVEDINENPKTEEEG